MAVDLDDYTAFVGPIVERFNDMREELDKERKFMTRVWAKRESQLTSVIESTIGMYGDLQGIAGKAMPEIESLDTPLLDGLELRHSNVRFWREVRR